MQLFDKIRTEIVNATKRQFGSSIEPGSIPVGPTKKEFEGDMTVVVFPLVRLLRKSPVEIGHLFGEHLQKNVAAIESFNVVQGFINLTLTETFWKQFLKDNVHNDQFGSAPKNGEKVMIEFSSPNTNKPLHLGHIRNILLGWSCSRILECVGYEVVKVQVINDRGIAICKSMLAWQRFGDGETPESSGKKGDHLVGEYYVKFEQVFVEEYEAWQKGETAQTLFDDRKDKSQSRSEFFKAYKNKYFNEYSALGEAAREMLIKWEDNDEEIKSLWSTMNGWVYSGFDATYDRLGVSFDKLYYESDTWKLGKDEVLEGVRKNVFFKKEDGSIWVDLSTSGMDEKILLRADGTSVYMTQDIGTAMSRYRDYGIDHMVYVVADEQNYHFKVLFQILELLEEPYAEGLYHLAYGMVDLPSGKMKSREGTVVDADDLIDDVIAEAKKVASERGDLEGLTEDEKEEIFRRIGMSALKYFILKVNPQKRMTFDPEASVDMQGTTGPYIQNAYVRIRSIGRKLEGGIGDPSAYQGIADSEKTLLRQLFLYPEIVKKAATDYDPSGIANYLYDLAKNYHRFYHDLPILNADDGAKAFRITLNELVANVLTHGMDLLGIEMPDRM